MDYEIIVPVVIIDEDCVMKVDLVDVVLLGMDYEPESGKVIPTALEVI